MHVNIQDSDPYGGIVGDGEIRGGFLVAVVHCVRRH